MIMPLLSVNTATTSLAAARKQDPTAAHPTGVTQMPPKSLPSPIDDCNARMATLPLTATCFATPRNCHDALTRENLI